MSRSRPRHPIRHPVRLAAFAALALIPAACGSSGPTGTSNASGSAQQNSPSAPFKFAACMRSHGVSDFPNPQVTKTANGTAIRMTVPASAGNTPAFKTAQKACASILPPPGPNGANSDDTAAHKAGLLSFAQCMRAHGVNTFPDPDSQGQIHPEALQAAHIDLQSSAVQKAAFTCVPASHGTVNAAAIHQAVTGGGASASASGG